MKDLLNKISPDEALDILKVLAKTDKHIKKKSDRKEMNEFLKRECENWIK